MKLAIVSRKNSFGERWIEYCRRNNIAFREVTPESSDIIAQLEDCDGLLWHWHHNDPRAQLFARQLTLALEQSGKKVFPDSHSSWHFDDKLGQKYLLEALDVPTPASWIFYRREIALQWLNSQAVFPLVFKLRGGAGSSNVRLVHDLSEARKLVKRMFGRGLPRNNRWSAMGDALRKWRHGKASFHPVLTYLRAALSWKEAIECERGYILFQEFIPDNSYDLRVIVIGDKAFSIRRNCRVGDFRASGSGDVQFEKSAQNEDCVRLSFKIADKMRTQCVALDFVMHNGRALVVECSYGFMMKSYDRCPGYWDKTMCWHEGAFCPQDWMIEDFIGSLS